MSTLIRTLKTALPLPLALLGASVGVCCQDAAPPRAGDDISRLTVLDLAAVVELVNADRTCGFESPAVIRGERVEGAAGSEGSATRQIEDCVLDLDAHPEEWPYFACDANAGVARGRVHVSGK